MTDLLITMSSSGTFTLPDNAGRIEEYCAKRLKIKLNTDFLSTAIKYYTLSFEPYSLSRKIITENIYRDSDATEGIYFADGYIFCPIYDYIAVSPKVMVQVDAYETDDLGNVQSIIKSGIFTLEFAPSLTGEGMMLESVRPDAKFTENVRSSLSEILKTQPLDGENLKSLSVSGLKIKVLTIGTAHLQNGSVTASKIATGAVVNENIGDESVTSDKLAKSSVTESRILNGAVTTDKIQNLNVTSAKLAAGAVTNAKLGNFSVSESKLMPNSVTTLRIANKAVTPAKLDRTYLTEHQSLEGYATESWVKSQNYLTTVDKENLPSKLSEFENDVAVSFQEQALSEEEKNIARNNIGAVKAEEGKTLSQNDFTDEDKGKLDSLATVSFSGSYNDLVDLPEKCGFTDILKENYNSAYEHSLSEHAPANAEENVLESVQLNGEKIEIKEKTASLSVVAFAEKEPSFLEVY